MVEKRVLRFRRNMEIEKGDSTTKRQNKKIRSY